MSRQGSSGPSSKVRLQLFTYSSNQCAFPDCEAPVFEEATNVGEVCHINANKPGGSRYDETMSDEERNAIENLVLLCREHHKIVDDNPDKYDAGWLRRIKAQHEAHAANIPGDIVRSLIEALAPPVPDDWWERPSAPEFRLHLASNRPKDGSAWTFTVELEQMDGGDVGNLSFRFAHGETRDSTQKPELKTRRKWRLGQRSVQPRGDPFEVELTFWWDGAERLIIYHWEKEENFQKAEVATRYQ